MKPVDIVTSIVGPCTNRDGRVEYGIDYFGVDTLSFGSRTIGEADINPSLKDIEKLCKRFVPQSKDLNNWTVLFKFKVDTETTSKYLYFINKAHSSATGMYASVSKLESLRQAGDNFTNFSIRKDNVVFGINHEIIELTLQDLITRNYSRWVSDKAYSLYLSLVPDEIDNITLNPPGEVKNPDITVYCGGRSLLNKLAFKGNWGKIDIDCAQVSTGDRILEIDSAQRLGETLGFRNIKINHVSVISHCFNSDTQDDNEYTFKIKDPQVKEIVASFNGVKAEGQQIGELISHAEEIEESFNDMESIPSSIVLSPKAKKVSKSLNSPTKGNSGLNLTVTSSKTKIVVPKSSWKVCKLYPVRCELPVISETNVAQKGSYVFIQQEPKNAVEGRAKTMVDKVKQATNVSYSPGAVIENKEQLKIAKAVIKNTEYLALTVETRESFDDEEKPLTEILLNLPDKTKITISTDPNWLYQFGKYTAEVLNNTLIINDGKKDVKYSLQKADVLKAMSKAWFDEDDDGGHTGTPYIVLPLAN